MNVDLGILVCAALVIAVLIWGIDRHLCLKEIEIDLKDHLGDLLVVRDTAVDKICACCTQSRVLEFKALIRKHFKL